MMDVKLDEEQVETLAEKTVPLKAVQ